MELVLVSASGASLGSTLTHTISIEEDDPCVELGSSAFEVREDGGPRVLEVRLSAALTSDVLVTLAVGGTATDGVDYDLDLANLMIPAGDLVLPLTLTPLVDGVCEHPETVLIELLAATGVQLGALTRATATIQDAGADVLVETEANDDVASANDAGALTTDRCLEIGGTIQEGANDPFDVFALDVPAPVRVDLRLRPEVAGMDLLLFVTDATGALILAPIQGGGPGETESATFDLDPALHGEIRLSVSCFGALGSYRLSVLGAAIPPAPLSGGSGVPWFPGRPADWHGLKESLRPGRGGAPSPVRVLGLGWTVDGATGEVSTGRIVDRRGR